MKLLLLVLLVTLDGTWKKIFTLSGFLNGFQNVDNNRAKNFQSPRGVDLKAAFKSLAVQFKRLKLLAHLDMFKPDNNVFQPDTADVIFLHSPLNGKPCHAKLKTNSNIRTDVA